MVAGSSGTFPGHEMGVDVACNHTWAGGGAGAHNHLWRPAEWRLAEFVQSVSVNLLNSQKSKRTLNKINCFYSPLVSMKK